MMHMMLNKNKDLVHKSDISGFINDSDLNKKIETLTIHAELRAKQDRTVKLQANFLNYLVG